MSINWVYTLRMVVMHIDINMMNKLPWCCSPVNQNTENTNDYLTMETCSIITDILGSMDHNDSYML